MQPSPWSSNSNTPFTESNRAAPNLNCGLPKLLLRLRKLASRTGYIARIAITEKQQQNLSTQRPRSTQRNTEEFARKNKISKHFGSTENHGGNMTQKKGIAAITGAAQGIG